MSKKVPAALAAFLKRHKGASEVGGGGQGGDSWNPKIGDVIEGKILEYKKEVGQYEQNLIVLETPKDGRKTVWLSAVLDQRISASDVGRDVVIYFESIVKAKKKGRSDTKIFRVYMAGNPSKARKAKGKRGK